MADIVERLRESRWHRTQFSQIAFDAADEIERLREALHIAAIHVQASYEAEHMMDGFGPVQDRPSDRDHAAVQQALSGRLGKK